MRTSGEHGGTVVSTENVWTDVSPVRLKQQTVSEDAKNNTEQTHIFTNFHLSNKTFINTFPTPRSSLEISISK